MTTMGGFHRKIKGLRVKQRQQQTEKEIRIDDNRLPLREVNINKPRSPSNNSKKKVEYVMKDDGVKAKKHDNVNTTNTDTTEKPKTLDVAVSLSMLKLTGIVSYCPDENKSDKNIVTAFVSFKNIYPGSGLGSNKPTMETFVPSLPIENICRNEKIDYYFAEWNESNLTQRRRSNSQENKSICFPLTLKSNKGSKKNSNNWARSTFIPYILEIQVGLIHAGGEMTKLGQSLLAIDGEAVDKTFYLPVHPDQDFVNVKPKKNKKSKSFKQIWKKGFSLDKNPTLLMHLKVELSKTTKQVSFIENTQYLSEESSIFAGIDDDNTISEISENDERGGMFVPKGILKSFDANQIYKDPNYRFKTYDEYSSNTSNVSFWSSEYTDDDEEHTEMIYHHDQPKLQYYQICNGINDDNSICETNSVTSGSPETNRFGQTYFSFNNLCGACKI